MKSIKTVVAELTEEEYNKAIEFKNVQIGKITWKDMIMGFIKFKESMDEVETESKTNDLNI